MGREVKWKQRDPEHGSLSRCRVADCGLHREGCEEVTRMKKIVAVVLLLASLPGCFTIVSRRQEGLDRAADYLKTSLNQFQRDEEVFMNSLTQCQRELFWRFQSNPNIKDTCKPPLVARRSSKYNLWCTTSSRTGSERIPLGLLPRIDESPNESTLSFRNN